jgi:hypothetical protein
MDIVSKINGNTLSATEFNQVPIELEALQTSSGQTSSDAILNQVSIATSRYAANNFYIDSGAANAYILSLAASMTNPVSAVVGQGYFVGMTIRFRAGNANSGASTVNVNSAGVKNLKRADGTTDLAAGDILTTQDSVFRYNGTSFILQKSFVAFRAFRDTSTQTIAASTATKAQLNGETFDTGSYFDSATNYRFTPLVAGYYKFFGTCNVTGVTGNRIEAMIYKNGSKSSSGSSVPGTGDMISVVSDLIYMNGSTDYVELYVIQYSTDGNENLQNGSASTFFSGNLIS